MLTLTSNKYVNDVLLELSMVYDEVQDDAVTAGCSSVV